MLSNPIPQTVQLRKGFLILATVIGLAVIGLILWNMLFSSHSVKQEKTNDNEIKVFAEPNEKILMQSATQRSNLSEQNALMNETSTSIASTDSNVASGQGETENQSLIKAIQTNPTLSKVELEEQAQHTPISQNQLNVDVRHSLEAVSNSESKEKEDLSAKEKFLQRTSTSQMQHVSVERPLSSALIQAGTLIPAVLLTGVNSDLPGELIAQVRFPVYNSLTAHQVLIPAGTKIIGRYDAQIAYGQERVLIVWNRLLFSNGQTINLQAMPGVDAQGQAGFHDQVDQHLQKLVTGVLLTSILSSGAQLAQPPQSNTLFTAPTVGQTLAQNLGTSIANTGNSLLEKNLSVQPTLTISPGYLFNILVTKDLVFPENDWEAH